MKQCMPINATIIGFGTELQTYFLRAALFHQVEKLVVCTLETITTVLGHEYESFDGSSHLAHSHMPALYSETELESGTFNVNHW